MVPAHLTAVWRSLLTTECCNLRQSLHVLLVFIEFHNALRVGGHRHVAYTCRLLSMTAITLG